MGIGPVILAPAMIAAELLFHPRNRLIGAEIRFGRLALGTQRNLGIEVNRALGAESETVTRQRGVAGIAAVEILVQGFGDARADLPAQSVANVEIFARYAKWHESLHVKAG